MSQIMVQAFARSLIDKIMLEAFDEIDTNDEKLQMPDNEEERGVESQSTRTVQQIQNRLRTDCNESETTEAIEKMVLGLRNLQIGDSTSVPYHLSKLEKQVKHVVRNIDGVSHADPADFVEMHRTQGEGDVHQIVHDAVIETLTEAIPTTAAKELDNSNEATRVSTSLIHRMIEELETKVEESDQKEEAVSKEKIEIWEETEERFIRTIESIDDPDQSNVDLVNENDVRNNVCNFAYEEITSSTPFVKSASLEEVTIEEITPSPMFDHEDVTSGKSKKMIHSETQSELPKRKGILSRTRKLLQTIFGRRKK
ncbi:hypothetical protein WN51_00488 [Melipona quadrifasciata]|uniref:Uncharacterized protein n=1 Tax=Melipona quadrifasciata TaxID=166423 RepID=A0A0M8ZZW2_9HYME|nr:hypothetical protein WN51_00488 [Melipona quadrifasciata]